MSGDHVDIFFILRFLPAFWKTSCKGFGLGTIFFRWLLAFILDKFFFDSGCLKFESDLWPFTAVKIEVKIGKNYVTSNGLFSLQRVGNVEIVIFLSDSSANCLINKICFQFLWYVNWRDFKIRCIHFLHPSKCRKCFLLTLKTVQFQIGSFQNETISTEIDFKTPTQLKMKNRQYSVPKKEFSLYFHNFWI